MNDLLTQARELAPRVADLRRDLHRFPEIGNHLPETRARVLEALDGLPLEIILHRNTSGVVAVLRGGKPGPAVILRGDMDALPLTEDTGLPFASRREGVMHACGHDMHTAMLAGAAHLLSGLQDDLPGSVVFMFQPGEEGFFGARCMLEEGLLEAAGERPTGAFAIHVTGWFPSGTVHLRPGPQLASADEVLITVTGKGGHASMPSVSLDPVPVAAEIVLAVETAITRRINVFDPGVITFGSIHAGTTHNIIPETAEIQGTIRALSAATRDNLHALLQRVVPNIAAAHGLRAEAEIIPGYPVTVNDPDFAEMVTAVAGGLLGKEAVGRMEAPLMGGEDWSYVLAEVPGAMAFLGACPPGLVPGEAPSNHSNRVVYDEEAMAAGTALHAAVTMAHLAG